MNKNKNIIYSKAVRQVSAGIAGSNSIDSVILYNIIPPLFDCSILRTTDLNSENKMPTEPNSASCLQILRVPRTDEPDSYVLLQVTKSRSDLAVVATEGENPYTGYSESFNIHTCSNVP